MNISSCHLLQPYNPVKDPQTGQVKFILGEVGVNEDLQAAIIESNFEETQPVVYSLGAIRWEPRSFSIWEICKIAAKDRICIARAVATLAICTLGIYLGKWSISSVRDYYKKYTEGQLVNIHYIYRNIDHYLGTRPLNLFDIIEWGLELTIMNIAYSVLCILPIWSTANAIRQRLLSEITPRVAMRDLEQLPSSGASLSHEVEDIFSKNQLSLTEARQPRKLTIGKYTGDIWPMIHRVLSKNSPNRCPHPIEDRAMTFEEREKFYKDIKNFLGIRDLSSIWSEEPGRRKQNFLSLLPRSIIRKYDLTRVFEISHS